MIKKKMVVACFKRVMAEPGLTESGMALKLDKFWSEWNSFASRVGDVFASDNYMWKSPDISNNKTHEWHQKYTFRETDCWGRFACIVTSKIVGIGNAERNWGLVKHLKSGQRAHMSSEKVSMMATIYGAACADRGRKNDKEGFTMWEDVDMDAMGLDKWGIDHAQLQESTEYPPPKTIHFKNFIEDWEWGSLNNKSDVHQKKLLNKYAGLRVQDGDFLFLIDDEKLNWHSRDKAWAAVCTTEDFDRDECDPDTFENMIIDEDLHGLIFEYYKNHPDPNVILETPKEHIHEDGTYANWLPNKEGNIPSGGRRSGGRGRGSGGRGRGGKSGGSGGGSGSSAGRGGGSAGRGGGSAGRGGSTGGRGGGSSVATAKKSGSKNSPRRRKR
jgi:hypothetical protein